jgi:hypothetical protein
MTLLLPRAKFSQCLTLLLSALLVCPSNLAALEREDARANLESIDSSPGVTGPRHCFHRADRRSPHHAAEWSEIADEPEVVIGRDDFRYAPLALPQHSLDLPSLVPTPLESRPLCPVAAVISSTYIPPLRC